MKGTDETSTITVKKTTRKAVNQIKLNEDQPSGDAVIRNMIKKIYGKEVLS